MSSEHSAPGDHDDASPPEESLPPLRLREPLPPVVDSDDAFSSTLAAIGEGEGPVAFDAERASGYRYSARAYLVQLRRRGSGTHLVDPIAFDDLTALDAVVGDTEWILHAATQDLPCLRDIGLVPRRLFDTELAGRLLNLPRVGLASLVQTLLGYTLAKEHSAADWSKRPLPEPWLEYAALDVEVLSELRDEIDRRLVESGKREWAEQEFDALLDFTGPAPREEPWRRTSGIHRARGRRQLALVRSLWDARDQIAASRDIAPGRVLPDSSIVAMAAAQPRDRATLRAMPVMRNRSARRHLDEWVDAVGAALALPDRDLPTVAARYNGPPPARAWSEKFPVAAARLGACREVVTQIAEDHDLPAENLLAPDTVRRVAWEPPEPATADAVAAALAGHGARQWQIDLTGPGLAAALDTE
ncbi:ribonuclease D [Solicola gregarius]|uniref:Ribonuclease D n=1 Tax=Solicola gregarius TaxID=2908642 RepID=A0AA46TG67_9ACTN|nr:ribonuclease D [Solicola gregarius]UYM04764.1 ribonuclease D [Solicola gregarius]